MTQIIQGWRQYFLSRGTLHGSQSPWPTSEFSAVCAKYEQRKSTYPPEITSCPMHSCSCGVYSLRAPEKLNGLDNGYLLARVINWGRVIEHTKGYRAQYSAIEEVWLPTCACCVEAIRDIDLLKYPGVTWHYGPISFSLDMAASVVEAGLEEFKFETFIGEWGGDYEFQHPKIKENYAKRYPDLRTNSVKFSGYLFGQEDVWVPVENPARQHHANISTNERIIAWSPQKAAGINFRKWVAESAIPAQTYTNWETSITKVKSTSNVAGAGLVSEGGGGSGPNQSVANTLPENEYLKQMVTKELYKAVQRDAVNNSLPEMERKLEAVLHPDVDTTVYTDSNGIHHALMPPLKSAEIMANTSEFDSASATWNIPWKSREVDPNDTSPRHPNFFNKFSTNTAAILKSLLRAVR